jgi:two-component system chemotaxis sensor kinase CheA
VALRRLAPEDLGSVEGRSTYLFEGHPIAVVPLATTLGLREHAAIARAHEKLPGLVLAAETKQVIVLVDELIGEQDIVVKNLGRRIKRLKHLSGATLLATGRIAVVLHVPDVVRTALARVGAAAFVKGKQEVRTRILIAEDSLTTRTLEKTILEAAGYEVLVAADGAEAWQLLNDQGADLVVSDVEMPRMDGLTLAATIRASKRFRSLPVVLMTSLDQPEHKQRGADAGADAYLVKSAFDQTALLDIIRQLT